LIYNFIFIIFIITVISIIFVVIMITRSIRRPPIFGWPQDNHFVGDNLCTEMSLTGIIIPTAVLQSALNINLLALR